MTIAPYWQSPDATIVVFNARFEDVLAAGLVPVRDVALIHADGPYGVSERTDRASKGRSNLAACNDFVPCAGDDVPFEPGPLLALQRPLVLWGANHFAPRVPESASWIVWDKRDGITSNDNADCELAWTNLGGPARLFRHRWSGMIKASERASKRIGSTQKPVALSSYVFGQAKLQPGALVFVPFLGSGPDLPAALALGLRVIACDVSEECCRVAVGARLGAVTAQRAAEPAGPLFCLHGTAGAPQIAGR